jgi:hypothetical protein
VCSAVEIALDILSSTTDHRCILSKVAKQTLISRHSKLVAQAETKRVVFYLQSSSPRVGLSLSLDANRIGGDR